MRNPLAIVVAIPLLIVPVTLAKADVYLMVGGGAGGGPDTFARQLAMHLGKYIPGNPSVIVQNKPGAGGLEAGQFLAKEASKDGKVIGLIPTSAVFGSFGKKDVAFDPNDIVPLGSADRDIRVCLVTTASSVNSLDDAKKRTVNVGSSGVAAGTFGLPAMLNKLVGTNFRVSAGYKSSAEIWLAMKRGEMDGICGTALSSFVSNVPEDERKAIRPILQMGPIRGSELPGFGNVPDIRDYVTDPESRKVMELVLSQAPFARGLYVRKGTPKKEVDELRSAVAAVFKDAAFLANAEKMKLDIDPMSGYEIEKLLSEMSSVSPELLRKAQEIQSP